MRRTVLFALFAPLLICMAAPAQVALIPKAGISLSNYRITKQQNITTRWGAGVVAGAGLNVPLPNTPWLTLQPELYYVQKTFSSDKQETVLTLEPGGDFHWQASRRSHYLEMPLLAKATVGKGRLRGFGNAGPSLGYLLGSKNAFAMVVDGQKVPLTNNVHTDKPFSGVNRLEITLQAGGGLALAAGPGTLLVEARYALGLTHYIKAHRVYTVVDIPDLGEGRAYFKVPADQKSRGFAFTCGYAVPLGKTRQ
jgi:hypothetical protein